MAHVEQAILQRLSSSTGLVGLLGSTDAIYFSTLPQKPPVPCIVFEGTGCVRHPLMGRDSPVVQSFYEVEIQGAADAGPFVLLEVSRQVRLALQRYSSTGPVEVQDCHVRGDSGGFEGQVDKRTRNLEVEVWWVESSS